FSSKCHPARSPCFAHDLFGKPVPTFPDHALASDRTNATRSCHGIVGVRQVDICSTAVGNCRPSLRFAGRAVLETRLGRFRQCRVRTTRGRGRAPAEVGHGR